MKIDMDISPDACIDLVFKKYRVSLKSSSNRESRLTGASLSRRRRRILNRTRGTIS